LAFAILLAIATHPAVAKPKDPLDMYVVRGETASLERFKAELTREWRGGKFLERLSSGTEHRYWAFPTRTAPEARQFIFGSINHGVQLKFEAYDEQAYYPKERAALDAVIPRCSLASDPFFIEPDRTLVVEEESSTTARVAACIRTELDKADVRRGMLIRFVSKQKRGERG
jgi:hypothetical protein